MKAPRPCSDGHLVAVVVQLPPDLRRTSGAARRRSVVQIAVFDSLG